MMNKVCELHGALNALSNLCDESNFVPFYGAEEIDISGEINRSKIEEIIKEGRVSNLRRIEDYKVALRQLLEKWIIGKLPISINKRTDILIEDLYTHFENLLFLGVTIKDVWHAEVEGGKWQYDGEMLLIRESEFSYYLYFSWSD